MTNKLLKVLFLFVVLSLIKKAHADAHPSGSELIISQFTLTDHHGNLVSEKNYYGKYSMVFFGFTSCSKICPLGLGTISSVLKKLGKKSEKIAPLFISIDPKRDDPRRLEEFLKNFSPQLIGLTGTEKEIEEVTKSFRAYYAKINVKNVDEYSFDHSSIIYLMDQNGRYLEHFESVQGVEKIADKIDKLLK